VDLKDVLGDIQTDCGNLHVDGSLMWLVATSPYGDSSPEAGAVHHIKIKLVHCSKKVEFKIDHLAGGLLP
jgi:hypothetical protein